MTSCVGWGKFSFELNEGGKMGFETMLITILISTIFVRNINLNYNIRKKK